MYLILLNNLRFICHRDVASSKPEFWKFLVFIPYTRHRKITQQYVCLRLGLFCPLNKPQRRKRAPALACCTSRSPLTDPFAWILPFCNSLEREHNSGELHRVRVGSPFRNPAVIKLWESPPDPHLPLVPSLRPLIQVNRNHLMFL